MTPVAKTNGSLTVARWVIVGLAVIGMLTTVIVFGTTVNGKTNENAAELKRQSADMKAMKAQTKDLLKVIHRMDKRQVLIMHDLGVVDHGDPGEPGSPE